MSSPNNIRRLALLGAAGGAVLLGGCGGGSSSGELSNKTRLAAKVNPICTNFRSAAANIPLPADFQQNPASASAYLDKIVVIADAEYAQLQALEPTGAVKSGYSGFVKTIAHDHALLKSGDAKAHARDHTGLDDLTAEAHYENDVINPMAERLGFTACEK